MEKYVLFIQGGGDGGYEADAMLVASLQAALGAAYKVHYPRMHTDEALPDFGWVQQINDEIVAVNGGVILVGHSLGASLLLKALSENQVHKMITGIFLVSTPFWSGDEEWKEGLKLREGFADQLPEAVPIFFYQSRDDEEVPFAHLGLYRQKLPRATFREISNGGHQLNNDMTIVAKDIQLLVRTSSPAD